MQIPDWFYRRVWFASADVVLYQFGLPVGSTVLVAASESGGSWGFGLSERREGVYSEAPGMFPVWTDLSIQVGKQSMLVKKKKVWYAPSQLTTTAQYKDFLTELILASSASSA